ncbi:MAG TPA: DinB family protein [Blastocatellia bacterium]|nr:DinB family protein [Blastocatellia bacterium]
MNKQALLGQREYFKMVHSVTVRSIAPLTNEELNFRPRPEMRSIKELFYHIYAMERNWAQNLHKSKVTQEEENVVIPETAEGKAVLATLNTVADLQAYANESHQMLDDTLAPMSDEDLAKIIETPFGSFPAWQMFAFAYDEHWHHRGQIYTYIRLLGKEPLMLYSYDG